MFKRENSPKLPEDPEIVLLRRLKEQLKEKSEAFKLTKTSSSLPNQIMILKGQIAEIENRRKRP